MTTGYEMAILDGERAVYPGHAITLALVITNKYASYEAAQAAISDCDIPGAGGNVHSAIGLLRYVSEGKRTTEEIFAYADDRWASCDGQATDTIISRHDGKDATAHYRARWQAGQEQADRFKDRLRAKLATWDKQ